ncbi:MAG: hypothetical protein HIU84_14465 [Acidobacteria bacterium]|nr:hypothetical protein [Acidobacteriota bacterium]
MRRRSTRIATGAALVVILGLGTPVAAFAGSTTTTGATTDTSAWSTFHVAWSSYVNGLKSINATYRASVQSADATFRSAMSAASTTAQRQSARLALDTALEAAINVRVSAITSIGNPPAPPAGYVGTAFVSGLQSANIAFRTSVAAAQSSFAQALASASTPSERATARAALKTSIASAMTTRAAALTALGSRPTHPGHQA